MSRRALLLLFFAFLLFVVDIISKAYAYHSIAPLHWGISSFPYGGVPIFHNLLGISFSLNYISNTGAAWGMFADWQSYLLIIRCIILTALTLYIFLTETPFKKKVALTLIAVGALGNILDFFLYGHVVDFFLFSFQKWMFPVFNVADTLIFSGVVLLLCQGMGKKKNK